MKQFLVHFDDSPRAARRLALARQLAGMHSGVVTALYAVTPSLVGVPFAAEAGAEAVAMLRELDEQRAAAAKTAFETAQEESTGPRAHWAEVAGYPVAPAFIEQALYADVIVLGQHDPRTGDPSGVPGGIIESTIFGSGKPALIVPYVAEDVAVPRNIAIAWKPTAEAARAVAAAVPLMQKADRVHVMMWGDATDDAIRGSRLHLRDYLSLRGVDATWHRATGPEPDAVGEMMLSRAFDLQCDLLVMGCYGHSRAREFAFGGASRSVLQAMTLPVLMSH